MAKAWTVKELEAALRTDEGLLSSPDLDHMTELLLKRLRELRAYGLSTDADQLLAQRAEAKLSALQIERHRRLGTPEPLLPTVFTLFPRAAAAHQSAAR